MATSRTNEAVVRELLRLLRKLAQEPGNRILILQRADELEGMLTRGDL